MVPPSRTCCSVVINLTTWRRTCSGVTGGGGRRERRAASLSRARWRGKGWGLPCTSACGGGGGGCTGGRPLPQRHRSPHVPQAGGCRAGSVAVGHRHPRPRDGHAAVPRLAGAVGGAAGQTTVGGGRRAAGGGRRGRRGDGRAARARVGTRVGGWVAVGDGGETACAGGPVAPLPRAHDATARPTVVVAARDARPAGWPTAGGDVAGGAGCCRRRRCRNGTEQLWLPCPQFAAGRRQRVH